MICPYCDGDVVLIRGDIGRCNGCYEWFDTSATPLEQAEVAYFSEDDEDDDE